MTGEALTAGAVARRLGVAVTTLRTWHQRYGLGPSHHVPGQHRRYTPEDMDRLQVMRRLTAQGVAPAEAAAWARRAPMPMNPPSPPGSASPAGVSGRDAEGPSPNGLSPNGLSPNGLPPNGRPPQGGAPTSDTAPGDAPAPGGGPLRHGGTSRDGGGNAIPVGRAGPAARGLARAAIRLDAPAARDILEMTLTDRGVVAAWNDVIRPVLIGVGERYAATNRFIEVEHLVTRCISEALGSVPRPPSTQNPRVLLSASDEEHHTLPLEALAAALAETGVASRLLGARVPAQALADAVARTGPTAVVVWSQLCPTADPAQFAPLLAGPRRPLLVAAAGPGWDPATLPPDVSFLASLDEAVRMVATAVG